MGTRRKSRELTLQMLFQSDMGKQSAEQVRKSFWSERNDTEDDVRGFADDLFRIAQERSAEIDTIIEKHAEHWRMERMGAGDRHVFGGGGGGVLGFSPTGHA